MTTAIIIIASLIAIYLAIGAFYTWQLTRLDGKKPTIKEAIVCACSWPRGVLPFLILAACLLPGLAAAADLLPVHATAEPTAGIGTMLLQTVFPVIGALLLGLVSLTLKWLGRKYKLEALAKEDNFILNLAHQGITLAEERAAQLIDSKVPLTGQNKLAIATGHVLSVMPKISEARAQAVIESLLARIPNVGATADKIYPVGTN
jgi:hypothetical protein